MLLLAATALAQEPTVTVSVDPLTWAIGFAHVQIEGRVSDKVSVYAGPHARLFDGILTEGREPYLGAGVEVGGRYFVTGAAPEGGWLMLRNVSAYLWRTEGNASSYGGYTSVLGGYTFVGSRPTPIVLSIGAGAQFLYYEVDGLGVFGPAPAAHTNIGWAF